MSENIYKIINSEYEKKQKAAFDNLISKKDEIYLKIPQIMEIDNEIMLLGIKLNKMIILGSCSAESAISELQQKIDALKSQKTQLLKNSNYPGNFLEIAYECPLCKDTGYVETGERTQKCTCFKQQLISLSCTHSNLKVCEIENFSTFDEAFFPEIVDANKYVIGISPRQNILKIKERCFDFIDNFTSPDDKNLFFSGPTGVGKTFISNCIASELIKRGRTVLYMSAPSLFNTIYEHKQKAFKDADYYDPTYKNIFDVELLIIDDLGTESPSAARYAELLNILNERHLSSLSRPCKTIISTNLEAKELYTYYTERVASRIIGSFDMFRFAGEDIRRLKKFNMK